LSISLNAANEIAVDAFLRELIQFTDIPIIIDQVLNQTKGEAVSTIADIIVVDAEARSKALESMKLRSRS
ncbi:MAG: 1-deoxy-D-xylulose-5-phosphate reductoisomerase, partial [bacterium]